MTVVEVLDAQTGELVPAFASGTLTPEQTKARSLWVREITKSALIDGVDYGKIPGTGDKPTLLKPGAEMLLLAAGLGFTMTKVDDFDSRGHHGITYTCTVMRGALVVSQCDGFAGYDESRFYSSAEDNEARERYNAARYERAPNPAKFVEYRAPWNTLVKMAQKRALVGATLNACAASGLFIADLDDDVAASSSSGDEGGDRAAQGRTDTAPRRTSGRKATAGKASAPSSSAPAPEATPPPPPPPPESEAPVAIEGTAELEAKLNKLTIAQKQAFKSWRAGRSLRWPPTTENELRLMTAEAKRIEAEAQVERDTYGG